MKQAKFNVVELSPERIVIKDIGHVNGCLTITNDAEGVVESIASILRGRRLFYIDSEGQRDELLVKDGKFAGFRPGGSDV